MKVIDKIDVREIFRNHFKTLVNDNSKKADFSDWFSFLIIPVVLSTILVIFNVLLSDRASNIVIATLSILVGLLFNVVVIIFDIIKRDNSKEIKNELLRQLLTNISYAILISLIIIAATIATYFNQKFTILLFNWLVYFLIFHFAMTVLMILKRIYNLFLNEINDLTE